MGKEIIQGIFGGLLAIIVVVSIGSFIAASASHGPAHGGEAAPAEGAAPAAPAGEAAEQPAETE